MADGEWLRQKAQKKLPERKQAFGVVPNRWHVAAARIEHDPGMMQDSNKKFRAAGVEPATNGSQYCFRYSPPLYQLSYTRIVEFKKIENIKF